MKIAYLASAESIHTARWVNAMAERGHEVHLLTMTRVSQMFDKNVTIHHLPFPRPYGYHLNPPFTRRLLGIIKPDLLHAHYASGYGTLGRLSKFRPYILSVWGSDVYGFPMKSKLNYNFVTANLRAADLVCSTSRVMADHTLTLTPDIKPPAITPFGIDTTQFYPKLDHKDTQHITIGTLKKLSHLYGIDILIRAFAAVRARLFQNHSELSSRLRLLIVGGGPDLASLQALASELGISQCTEFTGFIPHSEAPDYLRQMDVYVAVSRRESFGVAVLEASACGLPVVVSDVDGLPEVVINGTTGIVVPPKNVYETANAIERLILSPKLRARMGKNGRHHVLQSYSWNESVNKMERVYQEVLQLYSLQSV